MVEYIEKIVADLTLADNTYTEIEILFPQTRGPFGGTGRSTKVPMVVIHDIDIEWKWDTLLVTDRDDAEAHLSESSQTAVQNITDQGCIEKFSHQGVGEATANIYHIYNMIERVHHYPPIMYPYDSIYFGAIAQGTGYARIRIGYTVRMVNRNELMRAMVPRR
jgi:hypothetical protein